MNPLTGLKQALNHLFQAAVAEASAPLLLEPLVVDAKAVDCFSDESQASPDQTTEFSKLGIKAKAVQNSERGFSGGEVILSKDPGKTYEKLVRNGHGQDVETEAELSRILAEAENLPNSSVSSTAVFSPLMPLPLQQHDVQDPIFPSEEEENSSGNAFTGADDAEDEAAEEAESATEEETNRSLQSKIHYQKLDTFA